MKNIFNFRFLAVGILFLSITLSFGSCANEPASDSKQPSVNAYDVSNSDNPYDFVGVLHNEGLALAMDMGKTRSQATGRNAIEDGLKAASIVLSKNDLTRYDVAEPPAEIVDELLETYTVMVEDADNGFNNYINSSSVSSTEKTTVQALIDTVLSLEGSDLETIVDNILMFETTVISNQSAYTAQEYEAILSTASTLRYSCAYWYEAHSESISTRGNWWRWLIVVASDGLGAWAGSSGGWAGAVSVGITASNFAHDKLFPMAAPDDLDQIEISEDLLIGPTE